MRRFHRNRALCAIGAVSWSVQATTARAELSGVAPTPAMPFWALILLVLLIAAVGYLMTRRR